MCKGRPIYESTQIIVFYLIFETENFFLPVSPDCRHSETALSTNPNQYMQLSIPSFDCYYKAGGRGQH
jgi:hypothetical protein